MKFGILSEKTGSFQWCFEILLLSTQLLETTIVSQDMILDHL